MRFGLVGTGFWAAEIHAAGLAEHPDAQLAGVWGRDPAKAGALAARYGVPAYPTPEQLFEAVDAVAFSVPPDVQAPLALAAAGAGKHLLLEKPIALEVPTATALVDAAQAAGVASVVFFTHRFAPNVDAFLAGAATADGWTGARAVHFGSILTPGNPFGASPWRHERGGLWDVGPHALSQILPVLGPVDEVTAMDGPDQTVYTTMRHRSGAVSSVALSIHMPPPATQYEIVFHGTAGLAPVPHSDVDPVTAYRSAVQALVTAVATGEPHACDIRFGAEVVAILAAADAARGTGRVTPLPKP
ncbi:MAG: Gfo/Idh/MocA family oxidoreductase [Micromonosporaceae bacterium]|nr:Gfo/Idh/MocA family oxidoreductase [Micromonosporaceae bacterium]